MNVMDNAKIQAILQNAQKHREVCMLAEALVMKLRIAPGQGLIPLLGYLEAYNNAEAVAYWVAQHLDEVEAVSTTQMLQELSVKLTLVLSRLTEE